MGRYKWRRVFLLKPSRFMNLSGPPVAAALSEHRLDGSHLLVVHDDLDLPLGSLRLRPGGGSGGHRGLQDIIDTLQTDRFARLKIGIGRPPHGNSEKYVLEPFTGEEASVMERVLEKSQEVVLCWLVEGVHYAMKRYNASLPPADEPDGSPSEEPAETDPREDSLGGHRGGEAGAGGSEGALE